MNTLTRTPDPGHWVAILLTIGLVPLLHVEDAPAGESREFLSPVYEVDDYYKSMTGPQSTEWFKLGEMVPPQVIWVTGFDAVMVGANGEETMPQDYMCHSNLDFDPVRHNLNFEAKKSITGRLFTLSQGQTEIRFPKGFGVPVLSSEKLSLTTQVLNLNYAEPAQVRHKVELHYVPDAHAADMKPLFMKGVYGLKLLEGKDGFFGRSEPADGGEEHGTSCLMGENAADHEFKDEQGRRFTGHWVVEPGREENHTLVTGILDLPFDTTIHAIAVHLHPFAESLTLRDLTTGEDVFVAEARQFEDRIGLAHVESFESEEGIPVYNDHEYELVSVYNNTTDEDQDSMAVMLLYMLDHEYRPPAGE